MTQIQNEVKNTEEQRRRGTEEMFNKDTHHRVSSSDPDTTVTYIVIFQDYNTENKTIVEMLW